MCVMCAYTRVRKEFNMKDAARWLKAYLLLHGPVETKKVREAAAKLGYTRGELRKAKNDLDVVTTNNWAADHQTDEWFWSLPPEGQ